MTARRMTLDDLGLVLDWAAAEGWMDRLSPGRQDLQIQRIAGLSAVDGSDAAPHLRLDWFSCDLGSPVQATAHTNHNLRTIVQTLSLCADCGIWARKQHRARAPWKRTAL